MSVPPGVYERVSHDGAHHLLPRAAHSGVIVGEVLLAGDNRGKVVLERVPGGASKRVLLQTGYRVLVPAGLQIQIRKVTVELGSWKGKVVIVPGCPIGAPGVRGVRAHLVDLVDPDDLRAVARVFDAVSDRLVAGHPEAEMR